MNIKNFNFKKLSLPILIIVAIILFSILLLPPLMGEVIQHKLERLPKNNIINIDNHIIKINMIDYQRGWFHDKTRLQIIIPQDIAQQTIKIPVDLVITPGILTHFKNGKLLNDWHVGWGSAEVILSPHTIHLVDPTKLLVNTNINLLFCLTGGFKFYLVKNQPFILYYDVNQNLMITLQQAKFIFYISQKFNHIKLHFKLNNLFLSQNNIGNLTIDKIQGIIDRKKGLADLWYGTQLLTIPHLNLSYDNPLYTIKSFQIDKLRWHDQMAIVDRQLFLMESFVMRNFTIDQNKIGAVVFNINWGPFNPHILAQLKSLININVKNNNLDRTKLSGYLQQLLQNSRLELALFGVYTPQGSLKVTGHWQFASPAATISQANLSFSQLILAIIHNSTAHFEVNINKTLLEFLAKNNEYLQNFSKQFIQSGLMENDGQNDRMVLDYQQQRLFINHKPLSAFF